VFRKEIRFGDTVTIDLKLLKSRKDFSRWTFQHHIIKNNDTLSAVLTVDGAWINVVERKLATPPEEIHTVFTSMPRSQEFKWQ
jgi:acyl-CoA thioester hydrolase